MDSTAIGPEPGFAANDWPLPNCSTSKSRRSCVARSGSVRPHLAVPSLPLADLAAAPLTRAPHQALLSRCWELRDNLTIYDATYVALAEALAVDFLTGDSRLANATGPRCHIEVFTPMR